MSQMKGTAILAVLFALVAYGYSTTALPEPKPRPFRNCDAARAAGPTPIFRGHPRWGDHLDADGDGRACEPMPQP
jgi:hypothetical protein